MNSCALSQFSGHAQRTMVSDRKDSNAILKPCFYTFDILPTQLVLLYRFLYDL